MPPEVRVPPPPLLGALLLPLLVRLLRDHGHARVLSPVGAEGHLLGAELLQEGQCAGLYYYYYYYY